MAKFIAIIPINLGMNARGDNLPIGELQILRSGAERTREWRSNAANAASANAAAYSGSAFNQS